jgi:N-acetylglutamate synthase-like GNAT family acetyltransferase
MTDPLIEDRLLAFERELERRCATRIEATAFGTAYLNLDFPRRYDSNFVWVARPHTAVSADALAADADRVLGEHDLAHRQVRVRDEEQGRRLAHGFLGLGWSADALVAMVQAGEPEPRPAVTVREMGFEPARPLVEEVLRREPWAQDEQTVSMLAEFRAVLERAAGARFFVAEADGRAASVCDLYVDGRVAQIEDVNTLEEFRGRGLASGVVLAAARAARERGCDLVFLVADDADWPKDLYGRLGFEPVSRSWKYTRTPA